MKARVQNLLLVTTEIQSSPRGGRELLSKLNCELARELGGDGFVLYETRPKRVRGVAAVLGALRGHIDGVNEASINLIIAITERESIQKVWVDGSNLGNLAAAIKKRMPKVEVTTFFHNAEGRFFWGAWRQSKRLHALGVLIANWQAERQAVEFSDKRVCLSQRDSQMLQRWYGRGATHLAPMILENKRPVLSDQEERQTPEDFALFVGGAFYANREGMLWFAREVAPRVSIRVCVVGRGFEADRQTLESSGNVTVVGAVDSLADWYRRAKFVIAPIFDGSGMKTKVAEALMYGKKIVGTPEAFSGYEPVVAQAGWLCRNADEFVVTMQTAQAGIVSSFDPGLRQLYDLHYSRQAGRERMRQILEDTMGESAK